MSKTRLPTYPKVRSEGKKIIIQYRNGEEMIWGEEASKDLAISVSKELNLELKAIEYVKNHVQNFISDIRNSLIEEQIPEKHLEQILIEGHFSAMKELGFASYSEMRDRIHLRYIQDKNNQPHDFK
jgi:hypothetical protein